MLTTEKSPRQLRLEAAQRGLGRLMESSAGLGGDYALGLMAAYDALTASLLEFTNPTAFRLKAMGLLDRSGANS
mgnify:CR=1 FL=1|jgi:hypothetical protein